MNLFLKLRSMKSIANKGFYLLLLCLFSVSVIADNNYKVDNTNSKVTFSGEHVGMVFTGVFEKWQAAVILPPAANSSINASFQLKSAKTGNFTYDTTLAEGDWFDAKNHPIARFVSQSVEATSKGYQVKGNLELKGISLPQTFVLVRTGNKLSAQFTISRLDYSIGSLSDPDAEWVSRDIIMKLSLQL